VNILKKILMILGSLFFLIIILIAFLAGSSSNFKDDYEPFAKQFLVELSTDWDTSNVIGMMSNSLKEEVSRQGVIDNLYQLKGLGELKEIGDITIENYMTHTDTGEEAIFVISTDFEAGHALWKVTVNVKEDNARVVGFYLVNFDGQMLEIEKVVNTNA
jgi:hypothetical protein